MTAVPWATIVGLIDGIPEGTATDAKTVQIVAFGVFSFGDGNSALLRSVTWDGQTWTFATPAAVVVPPVEAVVPTPIQDPATFTG